MSVRVCISECQLTTKRTSTSLNMEVRQIRMAKITSLRGSWTFLGTFSFVTRVARNMKIKPNKHLKFKTKIYQKSNALVRGRKISNYPFKVLLPRASFYRISQAIISDLFQVRTLSWSCISYSVLWREDLKFKKSERIKISLVFV